MNMGVRLFGVISADKPPNKGAMKAVLTKAWSGFGSVKISTRADNTMVITAESEETAAQILAGSPWSAMKHSVHIQTWPAHLMVDELPTDQITFWVQLHGLPLIKYTERMHER